MVVPASKLSPVFIVVLWTDHNDLILPNTNEDKCPAYWDGVMPRLSLWNLLLFELSRLRFVAVRRVTTESFWLSDGGLKTAAKPC